MKTLGELFSITTGLVVKRKEAHPENSKFKYKTITLKSLNKSGFLQSEYLDDFYSIEEIDEKYIAKAGDIVIRLSEPFTSAVIDKESEGIIITSLFGLLKLKTKEVKSDYIPIYLNSELMKRQYMRESSGSVLQIIKASSIKNYKVVVPSILRQEKIIELNKLMVRETVLLEELIKNKKTYNKILLNKLMED